MRKRIVLFVLVTASICAIATPSVLAQANNFRQSIGISAKASSNGYGGDVYYRPFKTLAVKAGYETLDYTYKTTFEQDELTLDANARYKTGATSLSLVYQPIGGFYLIGGAAMLNFKPSVFAVSAGSYPIGDISVPAEKVGTINVSVLPQNKIAPYAGFGIGNAFPRDWPVSFSLEIGAFYMGSPQLDVKATGMLAPNMDPEHIATLENEVTDFKFLPVVKFNLGIRIFSFGKK